MLAPRLKRLVFYRSIRCYRSCGMPLPIISAATRGQRHPACIRNDAELARALETPDKVSVTVMFVEPPRCRYIDDDEPAPTSVAR